MESLTDISTLILHGEVEAAIRQLDVLLQREDYPEKARAYYLRGNAYRKQGNWQEAINCYMEAIELNPDSPAVEAKAMLDDILNFYNKDAYNP